MIRAFINQDASIMALLPSFETVLLKVQQGLGLDLKLGPRKQRFIEQKMRLDNHLDMVGSLLDGIFTSLEMDEQARKDAMGNILEWANFYKALELNTWTGNASEQQVLWHLLAYAYVPGLARRLAFWSLAGMEVQRPFDTGMPGGEFWFLPDWDMEADKVELPVPQVINWLLDLLDASSFQESKTGLGRKLLREENGDDSVVATLRNWSKGTKPQSAEKIEQLFPDDATLDFAGAFLLDKSSSVDEQFQAALALILRKGLDAHTLRNQIPMAVEQLEPIVNGNATEEDKQKFIRLIALRYAKPSMSTIRQRLRVARAAQDGYRSLLKALCGDKIDATCTDPTQNKLLQLIVLFQNIYNLTIAAWKNADSVEDQDAWFEAQFAPWDREDLLLSIMPSQRETAYLELAQRLTRQFMSLEQDSPLEDLIALGGWNAKSVIDRRRLSLRQEHEEDLRLMALIDKVRRSSPWRSLETESSFWVLSQFAQEKTLSDNARAMAIKRMRNLAATPGQTVSAIMLELGFLLNEEPKQRPKDIQQRVQSLLDEAQASQGYEEWKAPLLHLRAKNYLMQNEFDQACEDFKAALNACSERGFGAVRGEIARDGWAAEIAMRGFIPNNQEVFYRSMLSYGMFPDGVLSIEDTAVRSEEFFWNDLYHPYPGVEWKKRLTKQVFDTVLAETFELIEKADWDGLRVWMKRHAKQLREANFKDARCDSVLLLWLKILHTFESKLPALKAMLPLDMVSEFEKVDRHVRNRRHAIGLLLEVWPEQAKMADFKGQTPLMLAADNGDAELTRLLATQSNVDAQDYRGRTALHSAVSGRSPECVAIVLDCDPDIAKVTIGEEQTVLHTALRFGQPDCVRLILEEFRCLASQTNSAEQTPLDMARDILENLADWRAFMHKENRHTGSKVDFEAIIALLESSAL